MNEKPFDNETIFNCTAEMVKQFDGIKNEDEYREKCIDLVYNTFNVDWCQAEVLFDMALYGESVYLSDTETEIEFEIQYNTDYNHFECWIHDNDYTWRSYWTSWNFKKDTPILKLLKDLDKIAKAIEKFDRLCLETDNFSELAPLI